VETETDYGGEIEADLSSTS